VRLLVAPGAAVVTSAGAYPTFGYHVTGFGGQLLTVPYRADAEDPEALLLAARKAGAQLVYLANPDNPMGSWHRGRRVQEMIERLPGGAVLCLDEAYADFAPPDALPPLDPNEPRVIRMRTFSKAHGMAGVRVGYAIGHPELIAAFDRVRNHFGVGRIAQAGALAALATGRGWRRSSRRWRQAGSGWARSRPATGSWRWRRRRTSSRSTAAATGPMRGRCCRRWRRGGSSCGCRSWRRRTAASG
jgi:histidinol-phosphate/aromatic aminotransferase/cobyric acid decarboxylase-like protein